MSTWLNRGASGGPCGGLKERKTEQPTAEQPIHPTASHTEILTPPDSALRRKLRQYAAPDLLVIDEVGYLSYSNRHADLLFELVSRRYQHKSTVVTTNRAFAEWGEVFPNAACVVSLIDRLMHRAEVVRIDGASYRAKEAEERDALRKAERAAKAPASRSRKATR